MSTNKKTTKTINRRTRRVLKRDSELFEAKPVCRLTLRSRIYREVNLQFQ